MDLGEQLSYIPAKVSPRLDHPVMEPMYLRDGEPIVVAQLAKYTSSTRGAEVECEVARHVEENAGSVFNASLEGPVVLLSPYLLKNLPRLPRGETEEELVYVLAHALSVRGLLPVVAIVAQ